MSPDKISRTKCYWTKCRWKYVVEKCRGQNVLTFWPITFCPHNSLSTTLCPWHFVRWHFVLEPLQAIYMRHANVSPASPSDLHFSIWLSSKPPFQSPNFRDGVPDPYPRWFVFRSNCSTKKLKILRINVNKFSIIIRPSLAVRIAVWCRVTSRRVISPCFSNVEPG